MSDETSPDPSSAPQGPCRGRISEVFSSLQGEGPRIGERMIFTRLSGCPWRCRYCDTPNSLLVSSGEEKSVEDVLDDIHHLQEKHVHKTVSFTGGEPLLQPDFLAALMASVKRLDLSPYLETSGTHPDLLRRVIGHVDVVSMDVKLPSAIGRAFWEEHAEFLKIAAGKAFLKIVLTAETTDEELERAFQIAASIEPVPTVVLQPVTALPDLAARLEKRAGTLVLPPSPGRVAGWWEWARRKLPDVRLIPQMHPVWGMP
jgi:7-carboxy-7-deazaguanine synthase